MKIWKFRLPPYRRRMSGELARRKKDEAEMEAELGISPELAELREKARQAHVRMEKAKDENEHLIDFILKSYR